MSAPWCGPASATRRLLIGAVVVVFLLALAVAAGPGGGPLTPVKAIVLGVVEGITEFLPVSSTGHLLVTQRLLGLDDRATDQAATTYIIAIQAGAIAAVAGLCRRRVAQVARGIVGHDDDGRRLGVALVVAFVPAAIVGVMFGDTITDHLFGVWPVIVAWIAGGVFLLWWRPNPGGLLITQLDPSKAAVVGLAQLVAFWPGTSRSLVTIAATLAVGSTMTAAVEFSFLLGLLTLGAATLYDLARNADQLVETYGWRTPLLGALVASVSAALAARWLLAYLRRNSLAVFGWYRITVATIAATLVAIGAI